jgi:hypothetical protein
MLEPPPLPATLWNRRGFAANLPRKVAPSWSSARSTRITNLLEQAINCDDADRVAKMIQDALGIESDDVVNYCFPRKRGRSTASGALLRPERAGGP